jgi:hypothetical protein
MGIRWIMALVVAAGLVVSGMGVASSAAAEDGPEFRWLDGAGVTEGIRYPTRRLQRPSGSITAGPVVEIEREEKRLDAQTTRVTQDSFDIDINGRRVVTERVVEEIRQLPGGGVQAIRTISRPDLSGRFSAVQRDVQEMTPAGTDAFRITRTTHLPGMGSGLVETERIQQIEKRIGENTVEIERSFSQQDLDGKWSVRERRESRNHVEGEQARTEERIYRAGFSSQLSLAGQLRVNEWTDSAGQRHQQAESHEAGLDGRMQLSGRVTVVRRQVGEGRQETTETQEEPNPVAPSEGLRLVRHIVEQTEAVSPAEIERRLEVREPDLDGGMRSVHSQHTIETR